MEFTEDLTYVALRAKQFRNILEDSQVRIEYYFISLLIYANTDPEKMKSKTDEFSQVKKIFESSCKEDVKETEFKIKEKLKKIKDFNSLTDAEKYLNIAKKYATESYRDIVTTVDLLDAILYQPTDFIKEFIHEEKPLNILKEDIENIIKQMEKTTAEKSQAIENKEDKEQIVKNENNEKISELMKKFNGMTNAILKHVKGQDLAVRAVAEGFFNAELLADSENDRKRPRATFLFAGPPGVGKTFLAEQMGKYLNLPFQRFDMSNYSDSHAGEQLIGQTDYYTRSKEGILTKYVKKHPKCILLFDEIEKAHLNVIYLFYQLLDAGILEDQKTNEKISFKDTYIIFTTNAGHNLYEGKEDFNLSAMSKKKIMSNLQNDINPITNEPFFPTAICSRLAAGTVLMFNHLQSYHLLEIATAELESCAKLFYEQYGIQVEFDNKIPSLLMYKEGGMVDARTLRSQCKTFFKTQILNCLELFDYNKAELLTQKFDKIKFYAENFEDIEKLDDVFKHPKTEAVMFFGNDHLGKSLEKNMPQYHWHITSSEEEAFEIFAKKDIQVILLDALKKTDIEEQKNKGGTIHVFDNISIYSKVFDQARSFIKKATELFPEIPIYLVDKGLFKIDDQLKLKFIQLGVRGIVNSQDYKTSTYQKVIDECLEHSYLQTIATQLKSKHHMVNYEISPKLLKEAHEMHIRARQYSLGDLVDAEDEDYLVADADRPTIKFDDVIGAQDAKDELKFFIDYLKNPKSFVARGLKPAKGILFYGPPGTGKTMLAKAMAGETNITFISESASNFVTRYVGSGPQAIRDMFKRARRYAPTILFIDEIDAIGRTRTGQANAQAEEITLNTLLTEMDGFKVDLKRPVFIIAATNFKVEEGAEGKPGYIDPALVRRFDRKIKIDLLNKKERYQLFDMLLKKADNHQVSEKMIENIADRSLGRNSSNLADIVSSAIVLSQKRNMPLTDDLFEEAFETFIYGSKKEMGYEYIQRVAWHEAGHAYMYWKNGQTPSYLTIVARGSHGGYMQLNDKDITSPLKTQEELLKSISVSLAGRACEIVRYGKEDGTSTGIAEDLAQATKIAKDMICHYGMDDEMGLIYIDSALAGSSEIAVLIHKKTVAILNEQMQKTIQEIKEGYDKISQLVSILLEKNSMTGEEIEAAFNQ